MRLWLMRLWLMRLGLERQLRAELNQVVLAVLAPPGNGVDLASTSGTAGCAHRLHHHRTLCTMATERAARIVVSPPKNV
jgi:hypothetical protein